jgi:hypothetical protein
MEATSIEFSVPQKRANVKHQSSLAAFGFTDILQTDNMSLT